MGADLAAHDTPDVIVESRLDLGLERRLSTFCGENHVQRDLRMRDKLSPPAGATAPSCSSNAYPGGDLSVAPPERCGGDGMTGPRFGLRGGGREGQCEDGGVSVVATGCPAARAARHARVASTTLVGDW